MNEGPIAVRERTAEQTLKVSTTWNGYSFFKARKMYKVRPSETLYSMSFSYNDKNEISKVSQNRGKHNYTSRCSKFISSKTE